MYGVDTDVRAFHKNISALEHVTEEGVLATRAIIHADILNHTVGNRTDTRSLVVRPVFEELVRITDCVQTEIVYDATGLQLVGLLGTVHTLQRAYPRGLSPDAMAAFKTLSHLEKQKEQEVLASMFDEQLGAELLPSTILKPFVSLDVGTATQTAIAAQMFLHRRGSPNTVDRDDPYLYSGTGAINYHNLREFPIDSIKKDQRDLNAWEYVPTVWDKPTPESVLANLIRVRDIASGLLIDPDSVRTSHTLRISHWCAGMNYQVGHLRSQLNIGE